MNTAEMAEARRDQFRRERGRQTEPILLSVPVHKEQSRPQTAKSKSRVGASATEAVEALLKAHKSSLVASPEAPPLTDDLPPPSPGQLRIKHQANMGALYGDMNKNVQGNCDILQTIIDRSTLRLSSMHLNGSPPCSSRGSPPRGDVATSPSPRSTPRRTTTPTPPHKPVLQRNNDSLSGKPHLPAHTFAVPSTVTRLVPSTPSPPLPISASTPAQPISASTLAVQLSGMGLTPALAPHGHVAKSGSTANAMLERKVVEAARATAAWVSGESNSRWLKAQRFINECMRDLNKPDPMLLRRRGLTEEQWREDKLQKLSETMREDPELVSCRAAKETEPMDGWTPLHAAAFKGNLPVVDLILKWEGGVQSSWDLDLQGRTALALAAAEGHANVVTYLRAAMEKEAREGEIVGVNAPIDLAGLTPVAWHAKSKAKRKEVIENLYRPGDPSICPATPFGTRCGPPIGRAGLTYGYGDAPGWRVTMEDAICHHTPLPGAISDGYGLFGVFDGHGGGYTSTYVAAHLLECFTEILNVNEDWKAGGDSELNFLCPGLRDAFLACDAKLAAEPRMAVRPLKSDDKFYTATDGSGSTAIVAVVTPCHVIVANAGDSRAVLVAPQPVGKTVVAALSEDQTGASPVEKERVERAGGAVVRREWEEDGVKTSVLRIQYDPKAEGQSVVPSRGFGDFYYKQKQDLPPEEQVVTVCPSICVHTRPSLEEEGEGCYDEYLLLACDGLFDVFTTEDAGNYLWSQLQARGVSLTKPPSAEVLAAVCDAMVAEALERRTQDNITVMVIWLQAPRKEEEHTEPKEQSIQVGPDTAARRLFAESKSSHSSSPAPQRERYAATGRLSNGTPQLHRVREESGGA